MNLAALASLTRLTQMGNLNALGMMPGGLMNPGLGGLGVPGSLAGLPTDTANFSGALGGAGGSSGSGGSSGGTYGSSSGSGGSGGGGSSSGDVTQDAAARAKKLGMEDNLQSGGTDDDMKKMIKDKGCETKEVNSPDPGTVKSEMSKPGVTGGVLTIEGHAVEINPGGDGGSAASSGGKGKEMADKQQGPNGTDGGCWACSSERAADPNNAHDGMVHDSGDGQKKSADQFMKENHVEALIVSIKKGGAKSSAA